MECVQLAAALECGTAIEWFSPPEHLKAIENGSYAHSMRCRDFGSLSAAQCVNSQRYLTIPLRSRFSSK
jgi:hypothetical protein